MDRLIKVSDRLAISPAHNVDNAIDGAVWVYRLDEKGRWRAITFLTGREVRQLVRTLTGEGN